MIRATVLFLLAVGLCGLALRASPPQLAGIDLRLVEVADSQSYFLYSYEMVNAAQSTWAIGAFELDISASSGTPSNLAVTGAFFELSAPGLPPKRPHAEVGPITPSGWEASLPGTALLRWYPQGGDGLFTPDSVAPGDTLGGFGIRSSYLPGLTTVVARPTVQSCCIVPDADDALPGVFQFRVAATTVAPRYMPEEVTIDLVQSQLETVCTDPLWLDDEPLCEQLADSLASAEARLAIDNVVGAVAVLDTTWVTLQEEQASMDSRAYWMLLRNVDQVYINLQEQSPVRANAVLCVCGPSGTTAHFTVSATGPDVVVSTPYSVVAEVEGVDPPGSGCAEVWQMSLDGTSLVDVTVRWDSVTAGRSLDEIGVTGGVQGQTVIGADSARVRHAGQTTSQIRFDFLPD